MAMPIKKTTLEMPRCPAEDVTNDSIAETTLIDADAFQGLWYPLLRAGRCA
jgi:hypothetical protein